LFCIWSERKSRSFPLGKPFGPEDLRTEGQSRTVSQPKGGSD